MSTDKAASIITAPTQFLEAGSERYIECQFEKNGSDSE
jgi:hypothetical protein